MDYDDNDFQSQNLHLAGEGSNNYPPVLRPYALPKFDFDDSLHGHLRFDDSLVETEVFLGIEGNEDNQWIEDFSRGSGGIVFSSSAAESCAISRHNNVWSEAASSESVEMLLKSVGQDEILPGQNIVKESDACDELGCIIKQMEPSLKRDESSLSPVVEDVNLQPNFPSDEIPGVFSGLKEDIGGEEPLVKHASQTQEGDSSVNSGFSNLDASAGGGKVNLILIQEHEFEDEGCVGVDESKVETIVTEPAGDRNQGDSSASRLEVDNIVSSVQSIGKGSSEVNNQGALHLNHETIDSLQKNNGESREENVVSLEAGIDNQSRDGNLIASGARQLGNPLCLDSKEESVGEGNIDKVGEPSPMVLKEVPKFHMMEGCNESVCSEIVSQANQDKVIFMSNDSGTDDNSKDYAHGASPGALDQEVEVSNKNPGICSTVEPNTDSVVEETCGQYSLVENKDVSQSDSQLYMDVSGKPEGSLPPFEDNIDSNVEADGSKNSCEGGGSTLNVVCSSAELCSDAHAAGTSEGAYDAFSVCRAESTKECDNVVSAQSDIHKCIEDVSIGAQENAELPPESSNMDFQVGGSLTADKMVASNYCGMDGDGSVNELTDSKLQLDATADDKSDVTLEDSNLKSYDSTFCLATSGNDAATAALTDKEEVQMSPLSAAVSMPSDKEGPTEAGISSEAGLSNLKTPANMTTELVPVCERQKGVSSDTGGQLLSVDQSPSAMNVCSTQSQTETSVPATKEAGLDSSEEAEVYPVAVDSREGEADHAEGQVTTEKLEKVTVKENYDMAVPEVSDGEPTLQKEEVPTKAMPLPLEGPRSDTSQNDRRDKDTALLADGNAFMVGGSFDSVPGSESSINCHDALQGGSCPAELDNPSSASLTVLGTSKLPPSETQEGGKEPTDQKAPRSGVIGSQDPKENDASDGDRSFTFEITPLADISEKEAAKNWQPFAPIQTSKISAIVGVSSSTSGSAKTDAKTSEDVSHGSLNASDRQMTRGGSKGTPERKTRRTSGKGKEAKKGSAAKETNPLRQSQSGDRTSNVSLSSSAIVQLVQSNEIQHYGHVESSSLKPFGILPASASSLPDLNSSASSSIVLPQPFTDLQQVQLRAQIFVYGALIQGTAPDEAYMISAFGGPDGGRSIWENAWGACIGRIHSQKSHLINPETPLQSRPGTRAMDQTIKQSKVTPSPVGRVSGKSNPVVNPIMPLSSPIWSIPTPSDSLQSSGMPRSAVMDYQPPLSPLHPHQTPPIKNFLGHSTSWISPAPFRSPWVAPPQTSAFDTGAHFSVLPVTETVQLTPAKELSVPQTSCVKSVSQGPVVQSGSSAGIIAGTPLLDPKKAMVAPGQCSTDPKPRKRKKIPASEEPGQVILHPQSQMGPVSSPAASSHLSASVSMTTSVNFASKASLEKFITSLSPSTLTGHLRKGDREAEQRAALSEETLVKLKEARMQAEDAAALAAAAVSHSQEIWNQMDKQRNSGLELDVETRLTSAAVAVAAAAAVAKAAAAAANVASNAALQAKMMADETLVSNGYSSPDRGNGISSSSSVKKLGRATPASILKGEDKVESSNSIIVAAKEAARRRVEAATAASKRAENIDAIVKAAELAAEAVSQAGKIVAMGDPLPLSELVEAGPDGYWKAPHVPPQLVGKSNDSDKKEVQATNHGAPATQDIPKELDSHVKLGDGISGSVATSGKNMRGQKGRKGSDPTEAISLVSEVELGSKSSFDTLVETEKATESSRDNVTEGSHVEIFKDGPGFKTAWYSANVLSLKDGKAYVCYAELPSDKGAEKLKEWVALEGEGEKAPKIRMSRPITAMPFEGTRKRRRAAMGDYNWSVGDRVDAYIQDGWWEGIITEKSKKDETTLTVDFPAQGETSVVKAWHLRPSLMWKDGKWIEWSSSRDNNSSSHEGDTRNEKRPRLGSPAGEVKGKDKISKSADILESGKPQQPQLLNISASEKTFNIGKSMRDENKPESLRMIRTGLQKEGSRVIFGVPKPGKKRKFMDVSKHYVADQSSKANEVNDSVKFAKYLMPQGGSRGWKNTSKSEPKEKRVGLPKPKVLKSGKPQTGSGRTIPQKDESLNASVASDDAISDHAAKIKDSGNHVEGTSGKHNLESQSFSISEEAEAPILFSSVGVSSDGPSSKKISAMNAKSERANKGKLAPAGGKLAKIEEGKVLIGNSAKSTPDVVEPRRSNRRIQPTSRLLEGLQSSLIISKIPSVSHDRGHKNQNRNTSRGNTHG